MNTYILYLDDGTVTQLVKCTSNDILHYKDNYIKTSLHSLDWINKDYKVIDGILVETGKCDTRYLLNELNNWYELEVLKLTSEVPESEKKTWAEQKNEARAYLLDNNALTPLIDAICLARGIDKSYLVDKIIEKADAYTAVVGRLTGVRQKLEKDITGK